MSIIDLHMHSIISGDADYTVKQLLTLARQAKLEVVSITDHNKIGSVKEAQKLFGEQGISVISGVEIDCEFRGLNIHILGYHIDVDSPLFQSIEQNYHEQDVKVTWQMVAKLSEIFGIEFDYNLLRNMAKNDVIIPEDVADVLIQDSRYSHMNWMKPYLPGGLRSDNPNVNFYWDMMAQGRVAHVEMKLPSAAEIIDVIHQTGGIAIIAHPGNNFKKRMDLFKDLIEHTKVDGIEVCSSYHSEAQTREFYQIAKSHGLLMTCGSDFHGKNKPSIAMGAINFYDLDSNEFYRG